MMIPIALALLVSLVLVGCNGKNSSSSNDNYTISFLDDNLNVINSITKPRGGVNIVDIAHDFGIASAYTANSMDNITSNVSYKNYNLNQNINFYTIANLDVIEIADQKGLNAIRTNLSGKYILLNDIELKIGSSAQGWMPIGNDDGGRFSGILSGNNHKITNLRVNRPSTHFVGLFSHIENAQIKNLGVEINGEVRGRNDVGGIAGRIDNSLIMNSYSTGNISGNMFVGGIAGYIAYSNITNSYSTGNIRGDHGNIGGISGYVSESSITNSCFGGDIRGSYSIGGIAGWLKKSSLTNNAVFNPSITGGIYTNRVVGFVMDFAQIKDNFALDTMRAYYYSANGTFSDSDNEIYHGKDKTIEQFKMQETYSNATKNGGLGWSFGSNYTNPWSMSADKNNGLPHFYWQKL